MMAMAFHLSWKSFSRLNYLTLYDRENSRWPAMSRDPHRSHSESKYSLIRLRSALRTFVIPATLSYPLCYLVCQTCAHWLSSTKIQWIEWLGWSSYFSEARQKFQTYVIHVHFSNTLAMCGSVVRNFKDNDIFAEPSVAQAKAIPNKGCDRNSCQGMNTFPFL